MHSKCSVVVLLTLTLLATMASATDPFIKGPSTMNWQQAEDWCLDNYGTHLASIHNDDEWAEAAEVCATTQCWLGGMLQDNGDWAWADSSSWDYTHWHSSQPDGAQWGQECLMQYKNDP